MKTEEISMQKFIEKELNKDSRTKLDFRVFNRETKEFFDCEFNGNPQENVLVLSENSFFLNHGEPIPMDKLVIQRYIGVQDRNDRKICEGDYLLTNEGNWCGFVVFCDGTFMLVDPEGGYRAEPEWNECEIISNICEMDGQTRKYIRDMGKGN